MSLIEILTAISLFCPQERTQFARGGYFNANEFHGYPEPGCVKKSWKCIDGLRTPPKDPAKNRCLLFSPKHGDQEFDHWIQIPNCVLPNDPMAYERCFR